MPNQREIIVKLIPPGYVIAPAKAARAIKSVLDHRDEAIPFEKGKTSSEKIASLPIAEEI